VVYALPVDDEDDTTEEDDGLSPLLEAAIALHEVYLSLVEGGFLESEALRILAYVLAEQGIG